MSSEYLVGDTIICKMSDGYALFNGDFVVLNPKTGEQERTLFDGLYNVSKDAFIEGSKLFIQQSPYQQPNTLHVIDVPSGEQLFHCTIPSKMSFVGARGDTLFVKGPRGLHTFEPDL